MASDHIQRVAARGHAIVQAGSGPINGLHANRGRPVVMLVRSLAMAALAGLGILVVLPAAIAAQAAMI